MDAHFAACEIHFVSHPAWLSINNEALSGNERRTQCSYWVNWECNSPANFRKMIIISPHTRAHRLKHLGLSPMETYNFLQQFKPMEGISSREISHRREGVWILTWRSLASRSAFDKNLLSFCKINCMDAFESSFITQSRRLLLRTSVCQIYFGLGSDDAVICVVWNQTHIKSEWCVPINLQRTCFRNPMLKVYAIALCGYEGACCYLEF